MEFYLSLIFVTFLLAFISKRLKILSLVLLSYLLMILMFRGNEVGTDTLNYLNHFYVGYGSTDFSVKNFEFIYSYSIIIFNKLTINPSIIIYFLSLITFIFIYLSFQRFKVEVGYGLLFFVLSGIYFYGFNGSRQIAAVSILLYAYSFLVEDKKYSKINFFLLILLACGIHMSSIYFIPLFFIPKKVFNIKISIFLFLLSVSVFLFFSNSISVLISKYLLAYYGNYSEILVVSDSTSLTGKIFYMLLVISQICLYYLTRNIINPKLSNLFFLSIILFLLLRNMHPYISRIIYGISVIQIIVHSITIDNKISLIINKNKLKQLLLMIVIIVLQLYTLIDMIRLNVGEIVPYIFKNPF